MKEYFKEVLYLLGSQKRRVPRLLLLFLAISALDLIGIGLIGPYVSLIMDGQPSNSVLNILDPWVAIPEAKKDLFIFMSVFLLCVFFIKAISAIWINHIIIRFSMDQQVRLRTRLMKSYQNLSYVRYLQGNSSEYVYKIYNLTEQYSGAVVLSLMKIASEGLVAIAIFVFLAWSDLYVFLLLLTLLSISVVTYDRFFRKKVYSLGIKTNDVSGKIVKAVHEGIEGLKEIRILGGQEYFYQQVVENSKKYAEYRTYSSVISTSSRYVMEFIMVSFIVLIVIMTILLEKNMQNLIPTLSMFGLAAIRLLPSVNILTSSLMQLRFSRDGVSRLFKDISIQDSISETHKGGVVNIKSDSDKFKELSVNNISFRYPGSEDDAINKVTLKIRSGEVVGFIGPSGSGKTTLIDILLGLLPPRKGEVNYNGRPLSQNLSNWHSHIAYLPQSVFLIDENIKRNVALGLEDMDIDEYRLKNSLKMARLSDLIEQMPKGVETRLGERGVRLSGGQRQRIALARSFYYNRDVLVLDESTSALDSETEREIVDEIQLLKRKKTIIVIAHRLSTLKHCDYIYKIENGRIVKKGTPKEML